jgi:hypothetical protein
VSASAATIFVRKRFFMVPPVDETNGQHLYARVGPFRRGSTSLSP